MTAEDGLATDPALSDYRAHLVVAEQKAQEDFDKTVLSLSGGALGVSFAFVKDLVGPGPIAGRGWLLAAWLCWGASVASVLVSYFASHMALRMAIQQVDDNTVHQGKVGGRYDTLTAACNAVGGALFLAGVVFIAVFVRRNLGG